MTEHRNIITVDGRQVAILDKSGIMSRHELIQYKYLYAKKHNIPIGLKGRGIGCVFQIPKGNLVTWKPE